MTAQYQKEFGFISRRRPSVVVDYYTSSLNKDPESTSYMIWKRRMAQQKVLVHL